MVGGAGTQHHRQAIGQRGDKPIERHLRRVISYGPRNVEVAFQDEPHRRACRSLVGVAESQVRDLRVEGIIGTLGDGNDPPRGNVPESRRMAVRLAGVISAGVARIGGMGLTLPRPLP